MKQLFYLFVLFSIITACNQSKGLVIKGTLKGAENLQVYLDQIEGNTSNILAKTDANGSGGFNLAIEEGVQPGIYRLRIGNNRSIMVLNGEEKTITISGALENMTNGSFTLEGNPATSEFYSLLNQARSNQISVQDLEQKLTSSADPLVAYHLGLSAFGGDPTKIDLFKKINARLEQAYPKSTFTQTITQVITLLEQQKNQMAMEENISSGGPAPDISLPDPKGNVRKLSDLKGKVVLLDFWASWCGPCRRENPNVVNVYNKLNKEGFEVFSVSLDRPNGKEAWIKAIEQDGLRWPNHVSDLQGWSSGAAQLYGVSSIPRTFILDRQGNIVATNVRGPALEPAIKEWLAKG